MRAESACGLRPAAPLVLRMLLLLTPVAAVYAGDPVPGIDVSLEQVPGGVVRTAKTDAQGNYAFAQLPAGAYKVCIGSINPPTTAGKGGPPTVLVENHNSSRSNKAYPIAPKGGPEQIQMNFMLGKQLLPGKDSGTPITIGGQGGVISGSVTWDDLNLEMAAKRGKIDALVSTYKFTPEKLAQLEGGLNGLIAATDPHTAKREPVKVSLLKAGVSEADAARILEIATRPSVATKEEGAK